VALELIRNSYQLQSAMDFLNTRKLRQAELERELRQLFDRVASNNWMSVDEYQAARERANLMVANAPE
jgi:hypothetical protein